MEHLSTGLIDLILLILGFLVGQVTKFKTPISVAILVIRMAKWYLDTHPQGKKIAKQTNIDEKFRKLMEDNEAVGVG